MSHDLVGRELVDEDGGNVLATPDRGTLQLKLLAGAQLERGCELESVWVY